jgi:hypothetical protein
MKHIKSKILDDLKIFPKFPSSNKADAKIRIVPIFLIIAVLLALTISSESDKQIKINLEFSNSTNYDLDNDGITTTKDIVDITVENTEFNWELNKDNLLTKWKISNKDTTQNICYGNKEGCSFINIPQSSENWDDILYVNYGKDGAIYDNIITSQVIYYDIDLSVPYSDIYYSKEDSKEVKFYEKDVNALENLKIIIKNKEGYNIGDYEIKENRLDYDLTISNKKLKKNIVSILSTTNQIVSSPSKAEIKNIRTIEDIEVIIDDTKDEEITTDIIAVNASGLDFNSAEITLAKHGEVNVILKCEEFNFEDSICDNWEKTDIEFKDDGDSITFNVTGFSAYGGANITIINIYSYPPLYGNWTVYFNTTGTADLKIKAINGTTWTNTEDVGSGYDLKFLEVGCGDEILEYEWINDEVVINDYSCDEIGYETQKELTTGKHYLEFEFGEDIGHAYNDVSTAITLSASVVEKGNSITAESGGDCSGGWDISAGENFCSISGSSCSATVTGIAVGTCTIRVKNATGAGQGEVTANLTVQDTTAPATDYTVNAIDSPRDQWENGIEVVWNQSSSTDVSYYTVYRAENQQGGGIVIENITDMGLGSYYINDTTSNDSTKIYYYGVTACDNSNSTNCNNGVWSNAVSINAMPYIKWVRILYIDGKNASRYDNNGVLPTTTDDLVCKGVAHDADINDVSSHNVIMNYTISILDYYGVGTTKKGQTTNCQWITEDIIGFQGEYDLVAGDVYCVIPINASETKKSDKISCSLAPYDGKEYGNSNRSSIVEINNTRPFASGVYITPSSPNESSTLYCNYTFNDIDYDSENKSAALFKWYINNEGLNDFIEIPDKTTSSLSGTFDKDDIVMCAVKVKDIDTSWLNQPLYDDEYVNGTSIVIRDNAKPQIIDFSDNSNYTNPIAEGDNVIFNVEWADYENPGKSAKMYVCDSLTPSDGPLIENGTDNLSIGNGHSMTYYTNLTGSYVETIAIKPNTFTNSSGVNSTLNESTDYLYDIYAFEVDNIGDPIPEFNPNNASTYPIAEDHNNAFTMGKWNYIKLQYNSQPLPNKHLAIVFCIDDDDTDDNYCKNGMSSGSEALYIRATEVTTNFNINTSYGTAYKDANIKINYVSTSGGETDPLGCIGIEYCKTDYSTDTTISCDYTTSRLDDEQSNDYYIKVCDDEDACSVWRQGTFFVNFKADMQWVNITTLDNYNNFTEDDSLNCTHNATDTWIKSGSSMTYTYKWYYDRGNTGVFSYYPTSSSAQLLTHANTLEGDIWLCEVTPNDGFIDGFPKNSSIVNIGSEDNNPDAGTGIPYITNVTDNSNNLTPTPEGSEITFNISWSDSNSTSLSAVYICNTTRVTQSGCIDYEFGRYVNTITSNPIAVPFTVRAEWHENQSAYVFIYDDTWIVSSYYNESFNVNHRPDINEDNITISFLTEGSVTFEDALTCNITDWSDPNGDRENESLREYKWWRNKEVMVGENSANITTISITGYNYTCGIKAYDEHGLSTQGFINSSEFQGTTEIIAPILWPNLDATKNDNIIIIGYINKTNINISAESTKDYLQANTNSTITNTESLQLKKTILADNFNQGSNIVAIYKSEKNHFDNTANYIGFSNHNRTYFERYKIAGGYDLGDKYVIQLNDEQNLSSSVSKFEEIYVYNSSKPSGWFNLSLGLYTQENTINVRGYQTLQGNQLSGRETTFNIYYDNEDPVINTSLTRTSSNENLHTIYFKIIDNYKINLSTLLLNITNGTYNVTHRYDNLIYNNESWNWGNDIYCDGNNTLQNCNVTLNLENGNYTLTFDINDSVGWTNKTSITNYLVDSSLPVAPTIYVRSIQNTTNLSVLWTDSSANITSVQYAVGEARYPDTGWNSTIGWTNATENPLNKIIDANNDDYPNDNESIVTSLDHTLSSDDFINRTGYASLKNFLNGTEMFNCRDGSTDYISNCTIVRNNGDGIYNISDDQIIGTNYSILNGSSLLNFTTNITYIDANHDNNYTAGEAIVLDNDTNLNLTQGYLNGSGIDQVLVNGTADMYIPLTTANLPLENHHFYYVSIQYKNDQNLFYSLVGSSLSIKYKISSGGGGENATVCPGPSTIKVNASLVSESRILNSTWNESIDSCYDILKYMYTIGTAKYPSSGYDSITRGWIDNGVERNASYPSSEFEDGKVYYWNVKAVNTIYQENISSSDGTTYYDQVPPIVTVRSIANDTNGDDGWLDSQEDNITYINVTGDEIMTCFISPYDKGYVNFNANNDTWCNQYTPSINVTCNLSGLREETYTYSVVCQDTSTPTPNKNTKENNLDITFTLNWPSNPNVTIPIFNQSSYHLNSAIKANTTYTDDDGETGTVYFLWYKNTTNIFNQTHTNITNGTIIDSTLGSGNFSKSDMINVTVYAKDSSLRNSSYKSNITTIENTAPTHGTPILNSSALENRSNESISCYAQSVSDIDEDTVLNYTNWYNNSIKIEEFENLTTIPSSYINRGDTWICEITPNDGISNGTSKNTTDLTIINTAPFLNTTINNIAWNKNSNTKINLEEYFADIDRDNLTYGYTNVENISITVNSSGTATFTPNATFSGIRHVVFNATDGQYVALSNDITLNITNNTMNITLLSPVEGYNSSNFLVTFNCSITNITTIAVTNVTLNIWNSSGDISITNTTYFDNLNSINASFDITFQEDGDYTWNCEAYDNTSRSSESAIIPFDITVDTTYPLIDFTTGTENDDTNISRSWTYVNVNVTEINEKNITFYLYNHSSSDLIINNTYTNQQRDKNWTDLADGNYTYSVEICDYANNCNITNNRTIRLGISTDNIPPTISNIRNSSGSTSITIEWNTDNEESNSTVYYGTEALDLNETTDSSTYTKTHSIILTPLSASTDYSYKVGSCDIAGNCINSTEIYNFTTTSGGDIIGGSSGGGGGSSTVSSSSITLSQSYSGGYYKENDKIKFEYNGKRYEIKVIYIGDDFIDLIVLTTSQSFSLVVGDSKNLDLDGDGKNDIEIKLGNIVNKEAYILIKLADNKKPLTTIPINYGSDSNEDDIIDTSQGYQQPYQSPQQEQYSPQQKPIDGAIPYSIAGILALSLLGGLVMKEKMRIDYIKAQPELNLHNFIKKAKKQGHHPNDIRKALIKEGWPAHMVDSASLHDAIDHWKKNGHNHNVIRAELETKGFSKKIINNALMNHYINEELRKRRGIKSIKKDLLKAGWNQKDVEAKLPSK